MFKTICIFEDTEVQNLYPLSLTRPVYDLRCGFSTLKEKIIRLFPLSEICLHCRPYLRDLVSEQNPGTRINELKTAECLFINGRLLLHPQLLQELENTEETIYRNLDSEIIAIFLRNGNIQKLKFSEFLSFSSKQWSHLKEHKIDARLIKYPWDLVHYNAEEIALEFNLFNRGGECLGKVHESAVLLNEKQIFIGMNANIKPGVVLDAESGPIYIGKNVTVMPNAVIIGPAFVGDSSTIKIGAKIYAGTSIGEVCKVGGEVEESIIHSYSNKQHDGFLGHAYLGQWVNLGADTNNSDLKNNYSSVKVEINGKPVDSGLTFVGLFMGDHSKTAINTMFNTGTVVGTMSNVFGAGFPPKFIPSFSWGGSEKLIEHNVDKAIATAKTVMARRNVEISLANQELFREIFKRTHAERKSKIHEQI